MSDKESKAFEFVLGSLSEEERALFESQVLSDSDKEDDLNFWENQLSALNTESDTLSLDFELGGDAARINLFNEKNNNAIIEDDSNVYLQSMAGYKAKITLGDLDVIKDTLEGKVINKVTIDFDVESDSQSEYEEAHEKLVLVRVDNEGSNVFLTDFTIEGETHFGGKLDGDIYSFNITRYFYQLLNNSSYTNDLYLMPAGAAINANRTILSKDIKLTIHYSEL